MHREPNSNLPDNPRQPRASLHTRIFRASGDFLQRLQAILWALGVVGGAAYLLVGVILAGVALSPESPGRDLIVEAIIATLFLLLLLNTGYNLLLRSQRAALRRQMVELTAAHGEQCAALSARAELELFAHRQYESLLQDSAAIDEAITQGLREPDNRSEIERRDYALLTAIHRLSNQVLPQVNHERKGFAVVLYKKATERFDVLVSQGLRDESRRDIRTQLRKDHGMAWGAIQTHSQQYEPNSDTPSNPSYMRIGNTPRHKSLVCDPCWVDGANWVVLCVTSDQVDAFSQSDFDTINACSEKIELILAAYRATVISANLAGEGGDQ